MSAGAYARAGATFGIEAGFGARATWALGDSGATIHARMMAPNEMSATSSISNLALLGG